MHDNTKVANNPSKLLIMKNISVIPINVLTFFMVTFVLICIPMFCGVSKLNVLDVIDH